MTVYPFILAAAITIGFDMPQDGKATVVLDGPDGRRVRNLVSGITFAKGRHVVEWDGRAEDGTGAPSGEYTVRVVTHPGIGYDYKGPFAAGGERLFSGFGWGRGRLDCHNYLVCGISRVAHRAFFLDYGERTRLVDLVRTRPHSVAIARLSSGGCGMRASS